MAKKTAKKLAKKIQIKNEKNINSKPKKNSAKKKAICILVVRSKMINCLFFSKNVNNLSYVHADKNPTDN